MQYRNPKPITEINDDNAKDPRIRIAQLESELVVEKEDKLMIMEATAQIYEELLALKSQIGGTK
ncbi:hypothetical protein [Brevibacillus porteri]|uniref:hypothetical protein n=1 Tax=Brevibacillus porteri TaxID=2126350 RepID=UPI00363AB2D3